MRTFFFFCYLLIQMHCYPQAGEGFTLSGYAFAEESGIGILDCNVTVVSPSGLVYKTFTDSNGFFSIRNVDSRDPIFEISLKQTYFFGYRSKLVFYGEPHDTIMNFKLPMAVFNYTAIPDIHFHINTVNPEINYEDTLAWTVTCLNDNPRWRINVIGYKDASEKKDLRGKRARLVYKELIKQGIEKDRLRIKVSNKPNTLNTGMAKIDYRTGAKIITELTEEYILMLPPDKQANLRQLNSCVAFEIFDEKHIPDKK